MIIVLLKQIISATFAAQVKEWLKSLRDHWLLFLLRGAATSRFTSRLYYLFFSSAFAREQQATLLGRLQYLRENAHHSYLLRRNIHRLEKGLLMQPRRDVFALDYIKETVAAYTYSSTRALENYAPHSEVRWAHDVLNQYFKCAGAHSVIDRSKMLFTSQNKSGSGESDVRIPYKRDLHTPSPITFEAFYALSRRRRSVRWYLDKPVPRAQLDKAVLAAAQAPSACNRQPFTFRIFDNPALVQQVATLPMGTAGYAQNIPVIVVLIGEQRAYFSERDRHLIYIDGSLAAMSFMLALETLGLSSCVINWPDIEEREQRMDALLNLSPDERPILLMAVGYPDPEGLVAYSQKKDIHLLRTYNKL